MITVILAHVKYVLCPSLIITWIAEATIPLRKTREVGRKEKRKNEISRYPKEGKTCDEKWKVKVVTEVGGPPWRALQTASCIWGGIDQRRNWWKWKFCSRKWEHFGKWKLHRSAKNKMMLGTTSRRGNLLSLALACFLTIEGMIDLSLVNNGPIAVCNYCNFSYVRSLKMFLHSIYSSNYNRQETYTT